MKKIFIPIITIALLTFGCDKIDDPIQTASEQGPSTTLKRRIVIEEFTGQKCQACPAGAREIERLVGVYGDQIIPVAIHAGNFAEPPFAPDDFTTQAGDDLLSAFSIAAWPAGILSRINNATIYLPTQWEGEFSPLLDDEPIVDITITNTFNSSTRDVAIQVDTEWLVDGEVSTNYKLQVFVIEDHIIAYQLDGPNNVPNYDHRHMLRGAVNTSFGTAVPITTAGTTDTQNFNFTLNAIWKESDCEVVAFLYKEGPNYEVMQANIEHVQ